MNVTAEETVIEKEISSERLGLFPFVALSFLFVIGISYGLFGHRLIETMYKNQSLEFLNRMIHGRGVVPLINYFEKADRLILTTLLASTALVLIISLRMAKKALILSASFFCISFSFFLLFEKFPDLAVAVHLDNIPYYAFLTRTIPDDVLVYRNRPFYHVKRTNYKGELYSPEYHVKVSSYTYEMSTDENGFRNHSHRKVSDVIILGDSLIEYGESESDTFSQRLEEISGLTVKNLGLGNYGPFQYLEILKRRGIESRPKYALFCYSEGTDLLDVREYLRWKNTGKYYNTQPPKDLFQRYLMVLRQQYLRNVGQKERLRDLVDLKVGDQHYKAVFEDLNDLRSPAEISRQSEWRDLKKILREFKSVSLKNGITPVLVYIPVAAHIYGEYTTSESSKNWLKIREPQVAAKLNQEQAVAALSKELDLAFISLSPVFEEAASTGKLLYYPFDTHWNPEGRQIAASFVARRLKEIR